MQTEILPQIEIGNINRLRIGDFLNEEIDKDSCDQFKFAVAFMRKSGLDRLANSLDALLNRGGTISGAVGIDSGITTLEALETLKGISSNSTIFYTVSGFIFHPKLYLMKGDEKAVAVIGSANLTRDGLFRNIELATAIRMDLTSSADHQICQKFDTLINELLDVEHPNIQSITDSTLRTLSINGLIKKEAEIREPGCSIIPRNKKVSSTGTEISDLFPPMRVPAAPPFTSLLPRQIPQSSPLEAKTPINRENTSIFVMQLSAFDSSHRTGVRGTAEVLIPHEAIEFFPPISLSGRMYPDCNFDVVLNTPAGCERHRYRLWYYEQRAVGTRIDEYRLRMDHETIDLSTLGGNDLLIINKLPDGSDPAYEVTILTKADLAFYKFHSLCNRVTQGKKWGIA